MTSVKTSQAAQVIVALILFVAALSTANSVFAPVAFALFIIALVWPLQKALQGVLPRLLALALSLFVMIVAFVAFGSLIVWAFGRVGRWVVSDAPRFQAFYEQITLWLEGHGIAVAALWSENFSSAWVLRAVQTDPPPLNWSTLNYVFWQTGGPQCRRSVTSPKRLSRSCARSMCWSRRVNPLPMRSARSA